MHYRRIWEITNNKKIPKDHDIHHIDGNRKNNNPNNLKCVSLEEHLEIHREQEDWGAVYAILNRMKGVDASTKKKAASKHQKHLFKNNNHNFQKISKEKRKNISLMTMKKRIDRCGIAFLGIDDTRENARNAGIIAAKKKAGFLNTTSATHGSKYVKGTYWWTNIETGEKIRSVSPPSDQWKRGMK